MMTSRLTWIVLGILLFLNMAGVAGYGFMLYKISAERNQISKATVELGEALRNENGLKEMAKAVSDTSAERAVIDGYFVDTKGSAKFLEKLQSFGDSSGAPIQLDSVAVEGKNILRVDMSVGGSFENIYRLAELLESTPYPIEIRSVNLSKVNITETGKTSQTRWSGNFKIGLMSFVNK